MLYSPRIVIALANLLAGRLLVNLTLRFSKNLSFVVWARMVSIAVNLTFLAVCSRTYGVVAFGQLVFVLATTSFIELIFCGSADSILVREQVGNPGSREENLRACTFLHLSFALLVVAATTSMAFYFRHEWIVSRGLIPAGIASACQILFSVPGAHFRSEQNMFFESILITGERIFFLCSLLAMVALKCQPVLIFGCLMISVGAKTVVAYWWLWQRMPVRVRLPDSARLRYFWAESLPMIGVSLVLSAHWRVDLFLMKAISSADQLGLYAASFRTMEMLRILPVDVITVAFPFICKAAASRAQDGQLSGAYNGLVRLAACASFLVAATGVLFAEKATHLLFGNSFNGAASPLRILILAFPLIFWNQIGSITLTATRRQRWMFYSLLGALAFQSVIDLALIPGKGAAGAGIGFALGEAALFAATLLAVSHLGINVQPALATVAKLVPAAFLVWLLARYLQQSSLLVACVLEVPAYALALLLFRVVTAHELHWIRDRVNQVARGMLHRVAKDTLSAANCEAPECEGATSKP